MWRDVDSFGGEEEEAKESLEQGIFVSSVAGRGAATGITTLIFGSTNQRSGSDGQIDLLRNSDLPGPN